MLHSLSVWFLFGAFVAAQPGPQVFSVGVGCADSNGRVSEITAPSLPFLGNVSFSVDLSMAPPSQPTFLYGSLGTTAVPLPLGSGCGLYLEFNSLTALLLSGAIPFAATTSASGTATFGFPIASNPALSGLVVGVQVATIDPFTSLGFVVSNALQLTLN